MPSGSSFQLQFQETGFSPVVIADNARGDPSQPIGSVAFTGDTNSAVGHIATSGTYGDFSIGLSIDTTKTTGTGPENRELVVSELTITNLHSTANHTLLVSLTNTGYVYPPGTPLTLSSSVSSSVTTPTALRQSMQGFADAGNAELGNRLPAPNW